MLSSPVRISVMRMDRQIAVLAFLVAVFAAGQAAHAQNVPTTVGPVQLRIPDGFSFANSGRQDSMQVSAWTKGTGPARTLLQVTIADMGSQLATQPTAEELAAGTEKYLRQFLGAVEKRRTEYSVSPVRHLRLAGQPASSATWTGNFQGVPAVGVMYCVLLDRRYIVSFHTQDAGSSPTLAMREAMKAFENAQATPP
jgi:hypothetical protein